MRPDNNIRNECSNWLLADDVEAQICNMRRFCVLAQWLELVEKELGVRLVIFSEQVFDAKIAHGPSNIKNG